MVIYKNGNYVVTIFNDGTKVRRTEEDEFRPAFAENCDVKITDKCSQGCPFCYEGCTINGKHGELFKYPFIKSLHPGTEMALNGNDMDHPDLNEFLKLLREQKVFANITVNQNQFIKNYNKLRKYQEQNLIHGIGVSLTDPNPEFIAKIKVMKNIVIHTINGILSEKDVNALKSNNLKILILGYKDLKRGVSYHNDNNDTIVANQKWLYDNLEEMQQWFDVVSFDNLALEQLDVRRILTEEQWEEFYMGDDGGFTFYIDMVKGEFAKNSLSQKRYPISDKSITEMFKIILENNKI